MAHTKIDTVDLDSPCRELFVHGLKFVVALPFFLEIALSCASTGGPIQL